METEVYPEDITLYLHGSIGERIPQTFARQIPREAIISLPLWEESLEILSQGPDSDLYGETWDKVLSSMRIRVGERVYFLMEDRGLWIVRDNTETRKRVNR